MEKLLALDFSIFSMVAVGFLVRKLNVVGKEAERIITDLVLDVILPCSIFFSFLGKNEGVSGVDFLAVFLVSIGIQLLALAYSRYSFPKEPQDRRISLGFAMICSNAAFLGNPITEGVFGAAGLQLASIYLIPQRIMMWTAGLALYSGETNRRATVKKVLTHPCVVACYLGLLVMATGITVPDILAAPVQSIGRCNTPMTMLMIGMILSEIDLKNMVNKTIAAFTVHRLILMPLLVFLICKVIGISHLVTGVSTLLAAMPAGASTTMMASKFNRDPQFAVQLVIFTTLCSIPAIMIWSMILS